MRGLFYFVILLFSSQLMLAKGNLMFEKANELYHNKNYDSAAALYSELIENHYCSADLFYNAGNAFYRTNKIGMAIWCYRKSLTINKSKAILDNYLLAKKKIQDPIPLLEDIFFIRWWRTFYSLLSVNQWAVLTLMSFLAYLLMMVYERSRKSKANRSLRRFLPVIFILSAVLLAVRYYNAVNHYEAIIIRSAFYNEKKGTKSIISSKERISEGIEVRLVSVGQGPQKDFLLVRLPDAREVWVNRLDIRKL